MSNPGGAGPVITIDQTKYLAESMSYSHRITNPSNIVRLGARLTIYAPANRALVNQAETLVKDNYNANEAGLRRKEGDYRAELVRLQGTIAYNLQSHKWLEEQHLKVLDELENAVASV